MEFYGPAWDGVPEHLMGKWTPTPEAKKLIEDRIKEKLHGKGEH